MRVTNNMLISNMMRDLNSNLRRLEDVNKKMGSGKKFSMPSDDPVGVARSLKLRASLSEGAQFKKNAEDSLSWIETTEGALMQIKEVLQRVRELTVKGASGILVPEDSKKIAEEVRELRDHLVSVGNSTYMGKYIFAGYRTDTAPVGLDGDDGSLKYNGDDGGIMYRVGTEDILRANFTALEIFKPEDDKDLLKGMQFLMDALEKGALENDPPDPGDGDFEAVGNMLGDVDIYLENVLAKIAEVGAKCNRMELVVNRFDDEKLNFNTLLSKIEDADIAEAIVQLKSEENVYMAALAGGARIIQPTLVDFLR